MLTRLELFARAMPGSQPGQSILLQPTKVGQQLPEGRLKNSFLPPNPHKMDLSRAITIEFLPKQQEIYWLGPDCLRFCWVDYTVIAAHPL
jgi:hypothetical protein